MVNRYGTYPNLLIINYLMRLKLLAKKCGFNKIKLKKPNIVIETKLKIYFENLKILYQVVFKINLILMKENDFQS